MKKYLKTGITALLAVALIVGFYYYMMHREAKTAEDDVEITQLHQVLSKQLDTAYQIGRASCRERVLDRV